VVEGHSAPPPGGPKPPSPLASLRQALLAVGPLAGEESRPAPTRPGQASQLCVMAGDNGKQGQVLDSPRK